MKCCKRQTSTEDIFTPVFKKSKIDMSTKKSFPHKITSISKQNCKRKLFSDESPAEKKIKTNITNDILNEDLFSSICRSRNVSECSISFYNSTVTSLPSGKFSYDTSFEENIANDVSTKYKYYNENSSEEEVNGDTLTENMCFNSTLTEKKLAGYISNDEKVTSDISNEMSFSGIDYDLTEEKSINKSFDNTLANISEISADTFQDSFTNDKSNKNDINEETLVNNSSFNTNLNINNSSFEESFSIDYDYSEDSFSEKVFCNVSGDSDKTIIRELISDMVGSIEKSISDKNFADVDENQSTSSSSEGISPEKSPQMQHMLPPPRRPLRKSASMKVNRRQQKSPNVETQTPVRTRTNSINVQDSQIARQLAKASLFPISRPHGNDTLAPPSDHGGRSPGKEGIFRRSFRRAKSHISRISSNQGHQVHHGNRMHGNKFGAIRVAKQDHFFIGADEGDLICCY